MHWPGIPLIPAYFHLLATVSSALPAVWSEAPPTPLQAQAKKRSSARVRPVCPRDRPGTRANTTDISLNSQVSPVTVAVTGDHYAALPWLKFETVWPKLVCIIMGY